MLYSAGFCETHQGFRYSMANCMLESAIEEILEKCSCYPAFHGKYFKGKADFPNVSLCFMQFKNHSIPKSPNPQIF